MKRFQSCLIVGRVKLGPNKSLLFPEFLPHSPLSSFNFNTVHIAITIIKMAMFGAIVAGRLVCVLVLKGSRKNADEIQANQPAASVGLGEPTRACLTDLYTRDETHFVFTFEQPYEMNHLTVFLTGIGEPGSHRTSTVDALLMVVAPFPEGYGASVHFQWPGKPYFPLGTLTNERPSAIYRLRPHLPSALPQLAPGEVSPPATLGIEIASLDIVKATAASVTPTGAAATGAIAKPVEVGKLAERIVKNVCGSMLRFDFAHLALLIALQLPSLFWRRCRARVSMKVILGPQCS